MLVQRLSGLGFCILFISYGLLAQDIPLDLWAEQEQFTAQTFPTLIAMGGGLVSLLYALFPPTQPLPDLPRGHWPQLVVLVFFMLAYSFLLKPLGFIPATALLLLGGFVVLGARKPLPVLSLSLGITVGFYFLMQSLGIYLEAGF